jgi:AcrR family transcriptional regulator
MPAPSSQNRPASRPYELGRPSRQRADARINRRRIIAAARRVFGAHGADASMGAVARHAGVGIATLYRHFPTRADLSEAAFAEEMRACTSLLDEAWESTDPGLGLYRLLETVCLTQATDRGFAPVFRDMFPQGLDHGGEHPRFADLVRRARAAGQLRTDFHPSDITLVLLASSGLSTQTREAAEAGVRRLLAYVFPALTSATPAPLPSPGALALRGNRSPAAS